MAPCSNIISLKARVQARLETIYQAAGWDRKTFFNIFVNTGLAGRTFMHFGIEYASAESGVCGDVGIPGTHAGDSAYSR